MSELKLSETWERLRGIILDLESENARLEARVAELERQNREMSEAYTQALGRLQAQLAWTPVSDWPSEPGCYEFTDGTCEDTACYELADNRWFGRSMDNARSPLDVYPYTMFRRIELPEAT